MEGWEERKVEIKSENQTRDKEKQQDGQTRDKDKNRTEAIYEFEWIGMLVCGINVGDKSCMRITVEFHSGDTQQNAQ